MKRGSSAFASTRLSNICESLLAAYGNDKGRKIYTAAEKILAVELAGMGMDDRGSKVVGTHIRKNILPGYACYRAMLDEGISSSEAVEFIKVELCRSVERMARLCKRLSSKSYAYGLTRFVLKVGLKYGYPKQGWTAVIQENNKERIRFDMISCLYCEELQKRGAMELCPAFCYTDVASYTPLAPAVIFIRENTLALSGVKCDFCFEKGKPID